VEFKSKVILYFASNREHQHSGNSKLGFSVFVYLLFDIREYWMSRSEKCCSDRLKRQAKPERSLIVPGSSANALLR
jgi:hypothetical protein